MARLGITYDEVAKAAQTITASGKTPTIESIRFITKTGSSTTLAGHLKTWKQRQAQTKSLCAEDNLPEEIVIAMKGLWQRVVHEANEKIAEIRNEFNETTEELKKTNEKLTIDNINWQELHENTTQEKNDLAENKIQLEKIIRTLEDEKLSASIAQQNLQQQLQEKQHRIDELNHLNQQAQANLEHYRETAREQRLIEQQRYENTQLQLEQTLQKIGQELAVTKQEKIMFQQQSQQALIENDSLKIQLHKLETQSESLMTRLTDALSELATKTQAQAHWQHQFQALQAKQDEQAQNLIELKTQNALLLKQTETINTDCHHLREQNQLLTHEKWLLGQEKAQLMGQLVQFEKRHESIQTK